MEPIPASGLDSSQTDTLYSDTALSQCDGYPFESNPDDFSIQECPADLLERLTLGTSDISEESLSLYEDQSYHFASKRFLDLPLFSQVIQNDTTIGANNSNRKTTEIIQASLYSLGYHIGDNWIDGRFGEDTTIAIAQFQDDHNLDINGVLDSETLVALDEASFELKQKIQNCPNLAPSQDEPFQLVINTRGQTSLYVLNGAGDPITRYKVSPGAWGHRTPSRSGTVVETRVRSWWYPPNSPWAAGERPQPPGVNNAMGLVKHKLFGAIFIHGTPKKNERRLGSPASHGCIRMSPTNILDLTERFVFENTEFELTRNPERKEELELLFNDHNIPYEDLEQGRELYAGYLTGELRE